MVGVMLLCALVTAETTPTAGMTWWVDPITVKVMHDQRKPFSSSARALDLAAQRGECERAQLWSPGAALPRHNMTLAFSALTLVGGSVTLPPSVWSWKQQGYVYANGTTHYTCAEDILRPDSPPRPPANLSTLCANTPAKACTTGCPPDPMGTCGGGLAPPGSCNRCTCNHENTTCGGTQPCPTCHPCLAGWYPDPLLEVPAEGGVPLIPAGFVQPLFVELCVPYETAPGKYSSTITIRNADGPTSTVPVALEVWPIDLPRLNASDAFNTAFRFDSDMAPWYAPGTPVAQQWADWLPFLAHHRVPADDIYTRTPLAPAQYEANAATGARWMNLMDVSTYKGFPKAPVPPGYVTSVLAQLAPAVANLSARGLLKRAHVYGFDEMHAEYNASVYAIFGAVKARWPALRTMAVLDWQSFPSDLPLDVWVDEYADYGSSPSFDVPTPKEVLRQSWLASRAGRQFWWYWCIGPSDPRELNTFVERPAIQARLLYWLAALHGVNGMLYYDVAIWSEQCPSQRPCQPVRRINGTGLTDFNPATWNGNGHSTNGGGANGDGSFTYPGDGGAPLGSIRLSNIADGIEDWQLFNRLALDTHSISLAADLITQLVSNATARHEDPCLLERVRREAARRIIATQAGD